MANYSISATQLAEGEIVLIRGKLGFSRLVSLIEGAELEASDQRKVQHRMSPTGRPHTTVTITDAEVVYKNPTAPTLEEMFVSERRYASKQNPASGPNWSIDNKSTTLPIIAAKNDDGSWEQITPDVDLASGLDVTLVLRVYKPKQHMNRGLSLDQVIVNETPRFYSGGMATDELAARGIVYAVPPRAVQAQSRGAEAVVGNDQVRTQFEDGLALPAPVTAPVAAPVVEPKPAQGQTAPAVRVPAPVADASSQAPAEEETIEQKLARLEAENAALRSQPAEPAPVEVGVGSAVSYDPNNPWGPATTAPGGITF